VEVLVSTRRDVWASVADLAEEALAHSEDDQKDDQPQLVDQVVLDERAPELIAGKDDDSRSSVCFSFDTSLTTSALRIVELFQLGCSRVEDTTYFGQAVQPVRRAVGCAWEAVATARGSLLKAFAVCRSNFSCFARRPERELYVDIPRTRARPRRGVAWSCLNMRPDQRELRVSAPDKATFSSRTMAMIAAAARTIYPHDASLNEVSGAAKEQLDEAPREDFAAPGAIEDAVVVFARGQRRDLR
jgi:hypothetical protein